MHCGVLSLEIRQAWKAFSTHRHVCIRSRRIMKKLALIVGVLFLFTWVDFSHARLRPLSFRPSSDQQGSWGSVEVSILKATEAQTLLNELASYSEMAWDYPSDECYARAYSASSLLREAGVQSATVWADVQKGQPLLRVETDRDPKGCTSWRYHVAAAVVVEVPGRLPQARVLDAALRQQRAQGRREALRVLAKVASITLSADDEARIDACNDVATLDRWIANGRSATTAVELLP